VSRADNSIQVLIKKEIPHSLVEDLKSARHNSMAFLVGYFNNAFKMINEIILERKYRLGQILNRPLVIQDIKYVSITNLHNKKYFNVPWPLSFPNFPYRSDVKNLGFVHIRDLLDAMNSYVNYDFNEVIRKAITSLENAFVHYKVEKIARKTKKQTKTFMDQARFVVVEPELINNLEIMYKTRNKIVHDKLRLNHINNLTCYKSILTLLYIYQDILSESNEVADYILMLELQFKIIYNFYRRLRVE